MQARPHRKPKRGLPQDVLIKPAAQLSPEQDDLFGINQSSKNESHAFSSYIVGQFLRWSISGNSRKKELYHLFVFSKL